LGNKSLESDQLEERGEEIRMVLKYEYIFENYVVRK
jgi:hypothetical protein